MTISIDNEAKTLRCQYQLPESGKNKTLPEFLLKKADSFSAGKDKCIIRDSVTSESHSYSDFQTETKSIASAFYKRGFRKGDVVIYMTYNLVKLPSFFGGVWRANGIPRAMYPEEDEETLLAAVEECRVGWIYCEPEQAHMCLSVAEHVYWGVEVIITHGDVAGCTVIEDFFQDDGSELPELDTSPTDRALMLCTSGTTGRSKAAVHNHETVISSLLSIKCFPWSIENPNLVLSKATHVTGTMWPLAILCGGGTSIVMDRITTDKILSAVHEYKPEVVWGFPTFLLELANHPNDKEYDLSSLKLAMTAGAPCTPPMQQAIKKLPNVWDVLVLYGLTESLPLTMSINFDYLNSGEESFILEGIPDFTVGKVAPGIELQFRDPATGVLMGPGENGEICVRSGTNFIEYFQNPEATRNAFADGFFKTGDIGYYDENGFVMIVDRLKEIFKYGGNHVSPTEIEDAVARHPAVSLVCVVGVPDPEGLGHLPRAFVTKRSGFDDTSAEDIRNFANDRLAEYKHLRGGLYIVDSLPQGKTGKVTRNLVAQLSIPGSQ